MNKVSVIIADDELLAREGLTSLLSMLPGVCIVGVYADGKQALEGIRALRPDMVILDVEMPELRGDEVLQIIRAEGLSTSKAVLVSATDLRHRYLNCCDDYLLKPLCPQVISDLIGTVTASRGIAEGRLRCVGDEGGTLMLGESSEDTASEFVRLKTGDHWRKVPHHRINWVEEAGDYVCLHTPYESVVGRHSILGVERQLNPKTFCRINASVIINLTQLQKTSAEGAGELLVFMKSGDRFRVDNAYRRRFQLSAT
ncbi:LytR/AlgR family response regulator transcription factor [Bowmanella yangjiangensis]|uniref:Response regulator transcription factor n=1 Tax=Bowmanella yangjiangensis TaxID=2811230 RepID=A0ABS3CVL3_9ALTE|nr:response regulator transcription factor [Bowmanella yangjiangensis]MBN7820186.1 response regulator transcription factor [Bowmanella yangjiangensis]